MYRILCIFAALFLASAIPAAASNQLAACTQLAAPFSTLGDLVLAPSLTNPPKVQLCHRVGQAARHSAEQHTDRAIDALRKFIVDTERSTPHRVAAGYAATLTAEAQRVINLLGSNGPVLGTVSGGVYAFVNRTPVAGAAISLRFLSSDQSYATTSDNNGLFAFRDLPLNGLFIVSVQGTGGTVGSAQASVIQSQPAASVLVLVEAPGPGEIRGRVTVPGLVGQPTVSVSALFPDNGREYVTAVASDGSYRLDGLRTDGTFILIAVDNASGGSASSSSFLTPTAPLRVIDISLEMPSVVNPDLLNGSFANGLAGWTVRGPATVVYRSAVFGSQN